MGFMDDIKGKAEGMLGEGGGQHAGLIKGIMEMLQDRQSGGLNGLIESFRQKGLGNVISSWIGTGQNQPISPDQVKEGMGPQRMEQVASKAGMSTDEAAAKLSEHLPNVVDKLTPEGKVPEGGMMEQGIEMLKSKLFH
jgi:uncharacterized protein YidB (DUF937 family)